MNPQRKAEKQRLQKLESHLQHAIHSRDNYLESLKRNSAEKRLEMPMNHRRRSRSLAKNAKIKQSGKIGGGAETGQIFHSKSRLNLTSQAGNEPLFSRLETSALFWDTERRANHRENLAQRLELLRPFEATIPDNYGILLESDVPSMEQNLADIRQSLVQMKQFRLSGPTSEYFQTTRRPDPWHKPSNGQLIGTRSQFAKVPPPPSLMQIRSRLLNMEWHMEGRIRQLLDEYRTHRTRSATVVTDRQFHTPPLLKRSHFDQGEHNNSFPMVYDNEIGMGQRRPNLAMVGQPMPFIDGGQPGFVAPPSPPHTVGPGQNTVMEQQPFGGGIAAAVGPVAFEPIRPLVIGTGDGGTTVNGASQQQLRRDDWHTIAKGTSEQHKDTVGVEKGATPEGQRQQQQQQQQDNMYELGRRTTEKQGAGGGEEEEDNKLKQQREEDESFRKMLEMLKNPRRFNLSSSDDSSTTGAELARRNATEAQQQHQKEQRVVPIQQQPLATTTGGGTASLAAPLGGPAPVSVPQMYATKREDSSDSDFFK